MGALVAVLAVMTLPVLALIRNRSRSVATPNIGWLQPSVVMICRPFGMVIWLVLSVLAPAW